MTISQCAPTTLKPALFTLGYCLACDHSGNLPENTQQATAHLRLTNPLELPMRGCGSGFGSLPNTKSSPGQPWAIHYCKRLPQPLGQGQPPGTESVSSNAALGGQDGVPGSYGIWTVVFRKLMQFQFLHRCQAHYHFAKTS